jgi:hypothetical protein
MYMERNASSYVPCPRAPRGLCGLWVAARQPVSRAPPSRQDAASYRANPPPHSDRPDHGTRHGNDTHAAANGKRRPAIRSALELAKHVQAARCGANEMGTDDAAGNDASRARAD